LNNVTGYLRQQLNWISATSTGVFAPQKETTQRKNSGPPSRGGKPRATSDHPRFCFRVPLTVLRMAPEKGPRIQRQSMRFPPGASRVEKFTAAAGTMLTYEFGNGHDQCRPASATRAPARNETHPDSRRAGTSEEDSLRTGFCKSRERVKAAARARIFLRIKCWRSRLLRGGPGRGGGRGRSALPRTEWSRSKNLLIL